MRVVDEYEPDMRKIGFDPDGPDRQIHLKTMSVSRSYRTCKNNVVPFADAT